MVYLAVPMIAVLLYSFSGRWTSHMLPDYYTLDHWRSALTDQRLLTALWRSIWMAVAVLILDILIVVPAVYWQRVRNPRIRTFTELSAAIPFVLPFVVIAFGILKVMSATVAEDPRHPLDHLAWPCRHRLPVPLLGSRWRHGGGEHRPSE